MSTIIRQMARVAPEGVNTGVVWERTDCLLCGSGRAEHLVEAMDNAGGQAGQRIAIVRCQDCGLCFTNPRPSQATMAQFYPASYEPHRPRRLRPTRPWLPAFVARRSRQERHVAWHGQGRLLDVGCGGGTFLQHMNRCGWQTTGLDVSTAAVDRIRTELGLHALSGTLPHAGLAAGSFDVVTMWHSLEHLHAPLDALREVYRLLVPGGRLLVEVPNIDGMPFLWFHDSWYGLDLPRHLTHFTPRTLTQMLAKAGFRVGRVQMVPRANWLRQSMRLMERTRLWHRWITTGPVIKLTGWLGWLTGKAEVMRISAEKVA
jgi:2-polyprenyl-3-methyl-5-hydroxy-6-metoxy-1,4-benzoquinol methylase